MPDARNIKLELSYDGCDFAGWQLQPGKRTVQGVLEGALASILGRPTPVMASGRTDSGVHALAQVVHFPVYTAIPADGLMCALNALMPRDVSVLDVTEAPAAFHACHAARSKEYAYWIERAPVLSPMVSRYVLHEPQPLDISAMSRAAALLVGEHDFASFMGSGSSVKTTVRTVFVSELEETQQRLCYRIVGSGFLRHMVRNIVGTLLEVGRGSMEADAVTEILGACDRRVAGPTAAPQGLYLVRVTY